MALDVSATRVGSWRYEWYVHMQGGGVCTHNNFVFAYHRCVYPYPYRVRVGEHSADVSLQPMQHAGCGSCKHTNIRVHTPCARVRSPCCIGIATKLCGMATRTRLRQLFCGYAHTHDR